MIELNKAQEKELDKFQRVNHIVTAFRKYLETSDKSLIVGFSQEELLITKGLHASSSGDRSSAWYLAIVERLEELREKERYNEAIKIKWKDRIITFILGIIVTVIGGIILWLILSKFKGT